MDNQVPRMNSSSDSRVFSSYNSRGLNKDRTLYCLHKLPKNQREHSVHIEALTLIRDKLDTLKRAKPDQLGDLPGFVFLLLAETSELEDLRSIVVSWLKTRFNLKRKRTAHGAND